MKKSNNYLTCLETLKPVRDTLDVINGKWKLPILISIMVGNSRFTDIESSIPGISAKVLTKELKDLEINQLITRTVIEDYPVKIVYKTTQHADTLVPIIEALKHWGINHRHKLYQEITDELHTI